LIDIYHKQHNTHNDVENEAAERRKLTRKLLVRSACNNPKNFA